MRTSSKVVVVGGGTMGSAVAAIFSVAGWDTHVVDTDELVRAGLRETIREASRSLGANGSEPAPAVYGALADVDWTDVDIVIECIFEVLEAKQTLFAELESLCPAPTPLTSNSSSFPISQIGQGLATLNRMLGLHFFMPAHLVPAVEVVSSEKSDEQTALRVSEIMREVKRSRSESSGMFPDFLPTGFSTR